MPFPPAQLKGLSILLFGSGVGWLAELPIFDTGNDRPLTEDPVAWGTRCWLEQLFTIPGIFRASTGALSNGDFPLLQGLVLVGALMGVIGNLAADLLTGRLDPRGRAQ